MVLQNLHCQCVPTESALRVGKVGSLPRAPELQRKGQEDMCKSVAEILLHTVARIE